MNPYIINISPDVGPCVAILHEDFDGNVALDGMNSKEFQERVYVTKILSLHYCNASHLSVFYCMFSFHKVFTDEDIGRVWGCVENAIKLMEDECNTNDAGL